MPATITLYTLMQRHCQQDDAFEADMQDLYERLELLPPMSAERRIAFLRQELLTIMNKYTQRTEH